MKVLVVLFTLLVFANAQVNLSPSVYKKLTNIQKLTEQKKYKEALTIIDKALSKKLKKADKAYMLQSKGFIYVSQNKYKEAIKSFEHMNDLKVMSEQNYLSTIYNMAQLHMGIKNYQEAIGYLNIWLKQTKKVNAQAYILLGQSYALLEKPKGAIKNINKAIALQKTQKKKVPTNWYELLFSNYYQVKNYKASIDTLHIIVKVEPKKKNYWIYLSQIYSLQKQPQKGLSVFEQAYNLGILEEKDTVLFVSFLFQNGLYYKGAQLLEKHVKNKTVLSNEKNLKLLFEAYFSAKEYTKSLNILDSLITKTKNSKYHLQKARVYNMLHKNNKAIKSYEKAIKDKKLKEYSKANLELSYLYHEKGMLDKCKECLEKAKKSKHTKKLAVSFLRQLNIN